MAGPYLNVGAWRTAITENSSTQNEELGAIRFENGRILRYCRAGALIPRFEAVRVDTTRADGFQVLQTSAATDVLLGIAETTLALNNYGWITKAGPATARVTSTVAAQSALAPSTNTGVLGIANTSFFTTNALATAAGLSMGSAIYLSIL